MSKSDELVDVTLVLFDIKQRAVLVGNDGERDRAFWLPDSQVEYDTKPKGHEPVTVAGIPYMVRGGKPGTQRQDTAPIHTFTMPEWLAKDRGLL